MVLDNQRSRFSIPDNVTYLNCSSLSPMLQSVAEAGTQGVNARNHPWNIKAIDWFAPGETLRELMAKIMGTGANNVALVPSVSYGMAVAAQNITLSKGQHILLLDQEYPSNVYAWREHCKRTGAQIVTIQKDARQTWTEAVVEKIDSSTGLVSVGHCHWTDGSIIDLKEVSRAAKRVNAKLVIDASQSLGAYPLDVSEIKPDFMVSVGYKWLLGPYGLGYLYADDAYVNNGTPIEFSWLNKRGSEDFARLVHYQDAYRDGARRFDAGEMPSFVHMPMAIAALTQVLQWGVANIQETLAVTTRRIETMARQQNLDVPDEAARVGHMIGINFSDAQATRLSKALPPLGIYVGFRGTKMRVSPYLYNNLADVDKLFDAIREFAN